MTGSDMLFDAAVIGGGPAGATAAHRLAAQGLRVALLDRAGRIKPCGGAVPPRLIRDFAIPDVLIVARIRSARMVAPSDRSVDMPIDGGYVGMVDRDVFDEWLRDRAAQAGATRMTGTFERLIKNGDGSVTIAYRDKQSGRPARLRTRAVIGADGANSAVARQCIPGSNRMRHVFAYHEIVESPPAGSADFDAARCDVFYQGRFSPDFYAWVFPHGSTTSIGTGSARKGFSLRGATARFRAATGLDNMRTIRCEGAPIPLRPLRRWDDGQHVVLAGDAAGVVAPASGEGIYYAMLSGELVAEAVARFCATGDARALSTARGKFMALHGRVFWILGLLQRFWYRNDWTRERFVKMCQDPDVQRLTWESYMNKTLVRSDPLTKLRIFFKDVAHLLGLARV